MIIIIIIIIITNNYHNHYHIIIIITIWWHSSEFNSMRFSWNHLCKIINSISTLFLSGLGFFPVAPKVLSSTKLQRLHFEIYKIWSFKNMLNRSRPRTKPSGTRVITSRDFFKDFWYQVGWSIIFFVKTNLFFTIGDTVANLRSS